MERKIGETFQFGCKTLQVKESASSGCDGCFFDEQHIPCSKNVAGYCEFKFRADKNEVIFVEATEQEQTEQPQKLNLCEVLKYCPKDEQFWSPMLDGVKFSCIDEERQMIIVETIEGHFTWEINADGTISIDEVTSPEVMLYPSKEMRDWSKFTAPWLKKERFDPQTLNPFDKVLVRFDCGVWSATLFSHLIDSKFANKKYDIICCGSVFGYCIPYNDKTKHLVGTKDEAPDFYKYWED